MCAITVIYAKQVITNFDGRFDKVNKSIVHRGSDFGRNSIHNKTIDLRAVSNELMYLNTVFGMIFLMVKSFILPKLNDVKL